MKISSIFLLTALILLFLQIPAVRCWPWWSIVAVSEVFDPSDKKTPVHLRCSTFDEILDDKQMTLCKQHRKLLSTTAIGTLQALNQCQKLFKDRPWNCSVFDSTTHYLGQFIDNGTRETAFLNAIISAGIAREVARKCKEQELDACACDFSVDSNTDNGEGITIIGGCGDNAEFGIKIAEQFTDTSLDGLKDPFSLVALHNNEVGRELVKDTTVECICHGVSGSCSVQTCFKKVPDIEQLGMKLLKKYDVAKHVKARNNELKPFEKGVPPLKKTELAYKEFSPNFCKRDLQNGVYGTIGRRCYPDRSDYTSCASLCCGGPVEQRVVQIPEDKNTCCKFVWCCYLDCNKCGYYNETHYFCK